MRFGDTPPPEALTRAQKMGDAGHEMRAECSERFAVLEKDVDMLHGKVRHLDAVLHGSETDKRGGLVMEMERFTSKMNSKMNLLIAVVILLCGLSYPKLLLAVKEIIAGVK